MHLKWSDGNTKLKKLLTIGFDIPAYRSQNGFTVCIGASACISVCYAQQGFYVMPAAKAAREHNLAASFRDDFVDKACEDLTKIRQKIVRFHSSGDFYSQEYLDKVYEIARRNPEKKFYAYTKSISLSLWEHKPKNFTIIQSEGGKLDAEIDTRKPHARIFTSHYARRKAKYKNGSNTDLLAIRGSRTIGLIHHGTKKLTPPQRKYFSQTASLRSKFIRARGNTETVNAS